MDNILAAPRSSQAFSPEQIARFFFRPLVDDTGSRTGQWRCRICSRDYRQVDRRGYTNLVAHVRAQHTNFETQMRAASSGQTGSVLSWVSQKAQERFGWISWIVEENLSLSFCEKAATRRNSNLAAVSTDTLRKNITDVATAVERVVAAELPSKFGIIFDGWSHDNEHYLAIFATYEVDGSVRTPLLSIAPIIQHPDEDHSADSHLNALTEVLGYYGKRPAQCIFLVGDNCSVNKKLARLMSVPLVGCASHRLNLAVQLLTGEVETLLDGVQQLMIKLCTLNQAARLRFRTQLHPVLRQDTRWGSTFLMVHRYFELLEFLDRNDDAIADLLPSPAANRKLRALLEQLKNIESVSKRIQDSTVTMWEVRTLFDALTRQFPQFDEYLGAHADIVGYSAYESAIVKIQSGKPGVLTRAEKTAVQMHIAPPSTEEEADDDLGFAERALKRARRDERSAVYVHVAAVAPTSNVAERLFSTARAIIGLDRHNMSPVLLQAVLILKPNRSYWGIDLVHQCLEEARA